MNVEASKADGGKLHMQVYSAILKDMPQPKDLPLQEGYCSKQRVELIREVVLTYRQQAILTLVSGLNNIRAWHDATHILEDALKQSPNHEVFAQLLQDNKKKLEGLKRECKIRGMDDAAGARTMKRGRVNKVPYPWIVPEELARSNTAVKRQKARFKEASSTAIIAASSVGGMSNDNFGVFAKCDIPKGQCVVLDKSIFCDYNIPGRDYCGACCESLVDKSIPVSCCQTRFCSDDCKSKALSNYHKTICSKDFAWLYDECKDVDFQSDAIPLVMLKILATAVQQGVKPLSLPCVATLTASYHNDTLSFFRLQHNVVTPIRILQTLGVDVFVNSRFDSWIIQTLFLRIENNMEGSTFGKRTSIGISPLFSMFNHDCDPSAKWGPKDKLLGMGGPIIVSALRDIKANEEIKVSYVVRHLPEHQRREKLRLQLGMICRCNRCVRTRAGEKEADRSEMDIVMEEHEPAEIEKALENMGLGLGAGAEPDMTKLMVMMGLDPKSSIEDMMKMMGPGAASGSTGSGSAPDIAKMMDKMGLVGASGSKPDLTGLMKMMGTSLGPGSVPDLTKMMDKMGASGSKPDLANMMKMMGSGLGSGSAPDMTKMMDTMGFKPTSGNKQT